MRSAILLVVLLTQASEPETSDSVEETTSHIRALIRGGWQLRKLEDVRRIWNRPFKDFRCLPRYDGDQCRGFSVDAVDCATDHEFVFGAGGHLEGFSIGVCVNDREEAVSLLRRWRDIVTLASDARFVDESGKSDRIRWVYKELGLLPSEDVTLWLQAEPERRASIWSVRVVGSRQ
jgi:hypothetical protein